jgi:hypothetical protein
MVSVKDQEELCRWMGITLSGFEVAHVEEAMRCGSKRRVPQNGDDRNYHEKLRIQAEIMVGDLEEYRRL